MRSKNTGGYNTKYCQPVRKTDQWGMGWGRDMMNTGEKLSNRCEKSSVRWRLELVMTQTGRIYTQQCQPAREDGWVDCTLEFVKPDGRTQYVHTALSTWKEDGSVGCTLEFVKPDGRTQYVHTAAVNLKGGQQAGQPNTRFCLSRKRSRRKSFYFLQKVWSVLHDLTQ